MGSLTKGWGLHSFSAIRAQGLLVDLGVCWRAGFGGRVRRQGGKHTHTHTDGQLRVHGQLQALYRHTGTFTRTDTHAAPCNTQARGRTHGPVHVTVYA